MESSKYRREKYLFKKQEYFTLDKENCVGISIVKF